MPAALIERGRRARTAATPGPQVTATPERPALVVVAERAAWVRVYQANGTVLFESILEKGETYAPPEGVEAPLIWAGNSGSVYVRVGEELRGPLGSGTARGQGRARSSRPRSPSATAWSSDVPEVISQSFEGAAGAGRSRTSRSAEAAAMPPG